MQKFILNFFEDLFRFYSFHIKCNYVEENEFKVELLSDKEGTILKSFDVAIREGALYLYCHSSETFDTLLISADGNVANDIWEKLFVYIL